MTEKQRDIHERVNDYYNETDIEKEEVMNQVIILLNKISEKVKFEEYQIQQKITSLLKDLTKI